MSVFHKDGLDRIVQLLVQNQVRILATGGTFDFISKMGVAVEAVEDITSFPHILDGRVKTLHPAIFGGILARSNEGKDLQELQKYNIPVIDLVVVDLYPFASTVKSNALHQEIIEKIDIGGISLIRAGAKNYSDVVIISHVSQYQKLEKILSENKAQTSIDIRKELAAEAFACSASYDSQIARWMQNEKNDFFGAVHTHGIQLRYGENPHQKGTFYGQMDEIFCQLHGKELSYNNLLDIDALLGILHDFPEPSFCIIKHNNACGMASDPDALSCWLKALEGDPISAFGGVIGSNQKISAAVANEIGKIFFEVLIAPDFDEEALMILKEKKNRILLKLIDIPNQMLEYRSILNGVLVQTADTNVETSTNISYATDLKPDDQQMEDLFYANRLAKHARSNTIVLVKNKQLAGSGIGQTSRIDACKQAIEKAQQFNINLQGAVMASDAFFPFPDCVELAYKAGISAVIQPGGSVNDKLSIDYCNQNGVKMVLTGVRHFRH